MPTQFDFGFLAGLLVGEGHFGGDGRQPHVTLRMHVRHQAIFDWLQRTFPGGRVYGPYHHGGRDYLQWMARGAFLRDELGPVLDRFLSPGLDQHSFDRYQLMKARYPQLAAGPGAPVLPPDRSRRASSRQPGQQPARNDRNDRNETTRAEPQPATDDFADLFAELREVWPG
ncbi:MAG TPA: hypothetical protein VGS06_45425 [Streptosporangiaceae bacterium]|nr:hypothetical protein [Streptosporangiaceae bacterium]